MPRLKLHTDVRRRQIAEAALVLIGRHGLAGLSVAAVAREVGIAPSAIYRHYRSKEEMLEAVTERMRELLHGAVERSRAEAADPVDALRRLLARHLRLIREYRAVPRILLAEGTGSDGSERRRHLISIFGGYFERVAAIIRDGQRAGLVRRDARPTALALLFLGLVQPTAILWSFSDGRLDLTRQAREAWPVLEQALRPGGPHRPVPRANRARPVRTRGPRRAAPAPESPS